MSSRITIKDIAKTFGCSANCVSRALMDAPDISDTTKQKIKQLADQMGYVYNKHAATLRAGKSRTVGILFDSFLNPFYFIMTNFIWERLDHEGYSIITFKNPSAEFDLKVARQIMSNSVDGLLSFIEPSAEAQAEMNKFAFPSVVIGRKTHGLCDCVVLDDYKGGTLAAKHFLRLGCKKPLYLGEVSHIACSSERGEGFADECKKAGVSPKLIYTDEIVSRKYAKAFSAVLDSGEIPDCVFCFSDHVAYEVLSVLSSRGITGIPVVGYDNIQEEIFLPGQLVSVTYDKRQMVDRAATVLLNKINGVKDGHSDEICIDVTLDPNKTGNPTF